MPKLVKLILSKNLTSCLNETNKSYGKFSIGYIKENDMTDLEKLKNTLTEIGIDFEIEEKDKPKADNYGTLPCNQILVIAPDYGDDTYYGLRVCFLDGKFVTKGTGDWR